MAPVADLTLGLKLGTQVHHWNLLLVGHGIGAGADHFEGTGHQNLKLSKTVPIQTDKGMHQMIFSFTPVQKA